MEIKKTDLNSINFNSGSDTGTKSAKDAPLTNNEEIKKAPAPSNPSYWQSLIPFKGNGGPIKDNFSKTFDIEASISRLCSNTDLQEEDYSKILEMYSKGDIKKESVTRLFNDGIHWYDKESVNSTKPIIDCLYNFSKEGEKDKLSMFNNLCDKKFSNVIDTKDILNVLQNFKPSDQEFLSFTLDNLREDETPAFYDIKRYGEMASYVNSENMEDVKEFVLNMMTANDYSYNHALSCVSKYCNPITGIFDKNICSTENALFEKYKRENNAWSLKSEVSSILPSLVSADAKTVDSSLIKLAEDIYFNPKYGTGKNSLKDKISEKIKRNKRKRAVLLDNYYMIGQNLPAIIESAKDANGAANKKNIRYIKKTVKNPNLGLLLADKNFESFNMLKDKEGIIDGLKFSTVRDIIKETPFITNIKGYIKAMNKFGTAFAETTLGKLTNILGYKRSALNSMEAYMDCCIDENGFPIEENIDFLEKIGRAFQGCDLQKEIFSLPKTDEMAGLINFLSPKMLGFDTQDVRGLVSVVNKYVDKESKLNPFVKNKLQEYCSRKFPPETFQNVFEYCVKNEENPEKNFNNTLFKQLNILYSSDASLRSRVSPKELEKIINGESSPDSLSFKTKVNLLDKLAEIISDENFKDDPDFAFASALMSEIESKLGLDKPISPAQKEDIDNFKIEVFGNKKSEGRALTDFEKTIKDSIPLLKEMKGGLKISYPRKEFLKDLSDICTDDEKIKILSDKTGMEPIKKDGKIIGYDGLISLEDLNRNDEFENSVYEICHNFLYNNEVITGDKKLDEKMNKIIKAAPEFINTIGKAQHKTQNYSLDIHQLLVLANSISNPDYQRLSDKDKIMLKTACLFHDMSKKEGIVDKGHQDSSAYYAKLIAGKFFKNEETKDRYYELVKNHHWLEEYSNERGEKTAEKMAFKFRRPNDFDIAKIMAKADLLGVSDEFYEMHKDALNKTKLKPIEDKLNQMFSTGSAIFTDYPIQNSRLSANKETFDGINYRVINLHNIDENEDMKKYGFAKGKKKDDINLLVHLVDDNDIKQSLATLKFMSFSSNDGALSESIISPKNKKTYCDRKYGVILSQINPNVININNKNQGSGVDKDSDDSTNKIFQDYMGYRKNFRNGFLKNLNLDTSKITDEDYIEFYKENLASKTSLSQFVDSKEYKIGKNTVKGKDIKQAIQKFQNSLFSKDFHNEIVAFAPKIKGVIAKEKRLEDVPKALLDFANKNNLPVILI